MWESFPIELPPSVLDQMHSLRISTNDIEECFVTPPNTHDLREVAFDHVKRRMKRLTAQQISDLYRTGKFSIPSVNYPDSPHMFQVREAK